MQRHSEWYQWPLGVTICPYNNKLCFCPIHLRGISWKPALQFTVVVRTGLASQNSTNIFVNIKIKRMSVDFQTVTEYSHNIYLVMEHLWKGENGRKHKVLYRPRQLGRAVSASKYKSWRFYASVFFASMVLWVDQWHVAIYYTKRGMDWTNNESKWETNILSCSFTYLKLI